MPSFRVDGMMILSAMAAAHRAQQALLPLGTSLGELVNVAPATGDAVCGQHLADWTTARLADLVRISAEVNSLLERLRLANQHYVATEAAIADIGSYSLDWTTL